MINLNSIQNFVNKHAIILITVFILGVILLFLDKSKVLITPDEAIGSGLMLYVLVWFTLYLCNRLLKTKYSLI